MNEVDGRIRFGSCKRSPSRLLSDINNFRGHVERFLESFPKYRTWQVEYVGIAPRLEPGGRAVLLRHDVIPQDLNDLTLGLG